MINAYWRTLDCYALLEISRDARVGEIKDQYRFTMKAWHPDRFEDDPREVATERAAAIREA